MPLQCTGSAGAAAVCVSKLVFAALSYTVRPTTTQLVMSGLRAGVLILPLAESQAPLSERLPVTAISVEAASFLLERAARGNTSLPPEVIEPLTSWMCNTPGAEVDARATFVLDALRDAAAAARPRGTALSRARDAALSLLRKGGNSDEYPDVRLSTHVAVFSAEHAAGPRRPPHGAAAVVAPTPHMSSSSSSTTPSSSSSSSSTASSLKSATISTSLALGPFLLPATGPLPRCPVHVPLEVRLDLTNAGNRSVLVSARPLQSTLGNAALVSVSPPSLMLKRGAKGSILLRLIFLRPLVEVGALVAIEVADGPRLCVAVRAASSNAAFGCPLLDVPVASAAASGAAGREGVPLPLALLRERLCAPQRGGAGAGGGPRADSLSEEGVFRASPSAEERENLRAQIDAGTFQGAAGACTGVAAAYMVKLFFRELPSPLLSRLPAEDLMSAAGADATTFAACRRLAPRERTLLMWLADLLVATAARETANKMGLRNLAICVGPNLFATDEAANPMEALMASQKTVALLLRVLEATQRGDDIWSVPTSLIRDVRAMSGSGVTRVVLTAQGGGESDEILTDIAPARARSSASMSKGSGGGSGGGF